MFPIYALAIDPSGSFNEGKGTTGWVVAVKENNTIKLIKHGTISAKNYNTAAEYWQAHIKLIQKIQQEYIEFDVIIEDYILYEQKALSQINSSMETSQLIGIIKQYCFTEGIKYNTQLARTVKKRWSNDILQYKKILPKEKLSRHVLDAIRHAAHYLLIKMKGK